MNTQPVPVLQTHNLSRTINGQTLVDDITIEVQRGTILAVAGPSGSGKTSFLRLLNRLDEPTSGTVLLEGQDYRTLPPQQVRQRVGMVLQSPYLFAGTVGDNIGYGPHQRGETLTAEQIEALLNDVGMAGYAERSVGNLSGGEAQRVSLVRTLANRPCVLLLDEPTSALDDTNERAVESVITTMVQQQHIACLMITHSLEQAFRIATHLMVVRAGKLAEIGPIEEMSHAQSLLS